MRIWLSALVAVAFAAGMAGEADAANKSKKQKAHGARYAKNYAPRMHARAPQKTSDGYEEMLLESAPFGSQRWWDLYIITRQPW